MSIDKLTLWVFLPVIIKFFHPLAVVRCICLVSLIHAHISDVLRKSTKSIDLTNLLIPCRCRCIFCTSVSFASRRNLFHLPFGFCKSISQSAIKLWAHLWSWQAYDGACSILLTMHSEAAIYFLLLTDWGFIYAHKNITMSSSWPQNIKSSPVSLYLISKLYHGLKIFLGSLHAI